jgi:single-strand DNA-binding protein
MAGETVITVVGNLVDDPELRFTPSGAAVAKFRVASTPRTFDKATNEWKDGESLFLSCSVWRQAAENVAESLQRGMRVVVQGRLSQRSYEDKQGVKRTVFELEADEVAVSLRNATAQVTKSGGSGQGRQQFQQARHQSSQEGLQDPWTQSAPAGQPGAWGGGSGGYSDEPPF